MDYFVEIAESPDIEEALDRLATHPNYPSHLIGPESSPIEFPALSVTHPGIWRAELVNWFHIRPPFAAEVWQQLAFCATQRRRLARKAGLLPWPRKRASGNRLLRALGLDDRVSEEEFRSRLVAATNQQLESARRDLDVDYRGPEFIERLVPQDKTGPARAQAIAGLIADPAQVRLEAGKLAAPVPFSLVLGDELGQIDAYRGERTESAKVPPGAEPPTGGGAGQRSGTFVGAPLRRALARNLVGLSFSGGGIRSATFNLGVLQALAKLDVLRYCDYLSTVSGGGYIGSWFTAWTYREARDTNTGAPLTASQTQDQMRLRLSPIRSPQPLDTRIRPIRYLREFSNYLTPQTGFFSADTWTMIAIYVRNLLLNLLVLLPLMAAVLLVPRLAFGVIQKVSVAERWQIVLLIIAVGLLVPLAVLLPNLRRASPRPDPRDENRGPAMMADEREGRVPWYARQGMIQLCVVVPFLIAACLTAVRYWGLLEGKGEDAQTAQIWKVAGWAGGVFFVYLGLIHWVGRFYRCWSKLSTAIWSLVIATIGAAGAAVGLFWVLGKIFVIFASAQDGRWLALAFGTPLTLAAYSFIVVVQLGLLGAKFPDEQREWWSRLRAWTLIYSLGWAALFAFAIWVPSLTLQWMGSLGGLGGLGAWAMSTYAGIRAARTPAAPANRGAGAAQLPTPKPATSMSQRVRAFGLLVAPYIFIAGLVTLVSVTIHVLLARSLGGPLAGDAVARIAAYPSRQLIGITVGLVAISLFVSWRIGVNEFSMHHFYKNRLVRCYLGASRWQVRKADWFTGFDANDDVHLSCFAHETPPAGVSGVKHPGPYPIVNATLNLVAGADLAWQERKAASFVFTPKYCGYDIDRAVMQKDKDGNWPDAYAPTRSYVAEGVGPTLGTAMAISGAAANPNMGKGTTAASAFLMTVFNARLGWWLPNPRRKGWFGWDRSGPALGINYTAVELFGMTDDEKKFVNLSDGGHFENLGVYELVRRGCRYIIVGDAGQDGSFGLEDLGNLVRKCRTDFGVEIDIGLDSVRDRNLKGWSNSHCVVGRIHYLNVPKLCADGRVEYDLYGQPAHEEGLLVYIKPTITGDEPFDILEYYQRVPEFPHETTADQWFNESQFESYRRLGMHIAETTFGRFREHPEQPLNDVGELFKDLRGFWYPPSPKVAEHSTEHTQEYTRLMELLRSQNLGVFDRALFPSVQPAGLGPQRDEFYVCNALIQLIENVYADLDLERNCEHPQVEGWMSVFRVWAKQPVFKATWELSKKTYASRFRRFYEDRLE